MAPDPADHLPLVHYLARRHAPDAVDQAGVLEAGVAALLDASRLFDPARGSWSALASVAVSRAVRGEAQRQRRESESLVSLTHTGADGMEYEREDLPHVEPVDGQRLMAASVRAAVAQLPETESIVIRARYGIGCEPSTLEEVGRGIGLSRERVRQIELRGVARLRKALK